MFGSGILDTVIGMVFVFLLVSMLVTIANEMIAAALMSRAKWLRLGIERLLGSAWAKQLYEHPLIEGTAQSGVAVADGGDGPSYIPSRSFANVLMSIIQQNAPGLAACQTALKSAFDAASGAGATLETLKAEMTAAADKIGVNGGVGAAAARDLMRMLDGGGAAGTGAWLAELEARLKGGDLAARPELAPLLQTLAALVADGVAATAGAAELRTRFDGAVTTLLTGSATAALRAELLALGKRLGGPYTVGDAVADIQWWMGGFSARYLREMIGELRDERMKKVLLTLFDDANDDVEKFKENLETWFNNSMDRVNGWYKRHSQRVVAALAFGIAVALNVDAVLIFRHLQTYSGAREAIVAQARAFAEKNPPSAPTGTAIDSGSPYSGFLEVKNTEKPQTVTIHSDNPHVHVRTKVVDVPAKTEKISFTVDTDFSDKPGNATIYADNDATDQVKLTLAPSLPAQFNAVQDKLDALSIPIGWVNESTEAAVKNGQLLPGLFDYKGTFALVWQHLFGWLLTALAATLGAPFWFDMLNRIMSIRAAGKPPEEDPKPPKSVSVPVEPGQSQREADRQRH